VSGIVGLIHLDGTPVDRDLLGRMTAFLAFRGPDAQATWADGPVGLGHTLLRTTLESEREEQPCSLDGQVWITADARIDDRANLIDQLAGHGREATPDVPDVELILHAYHVWGERCVEHLLGDFAFVVWDGRRRRLFGARDHFGVKPFYYALAGGCFLFSNTLNCLRLHPAVSDELNDRAIADCLLFECNQDPGTTVFADVLRLPPAHSFTCAPGEGLRQQRYWTLPTDGRIRYRREADYVEHFQTLLRASVADRLRSRRVGVFMSGGLDSPSVAATAHKLLSSQPGAFDLRAHTIVYDRLIPDQERHYSGLVARTLGIPIRYLVADDYDWFDHSDKLALRTPEPVMNLMAALHLDLHRQTAENARVVLTGNGGDPLLFSTTAVDLARSLPLPRLVVDVGRFLLSRRRFPSLGVRGKVKRWLGWRPWTPPYPTWLNKSFAERLELRTRWERLNAPAPPAHPLRGKAHALLLGTIWPHWFETCDPGVTSLPVEARHPFFDVRLVNYALALPPLPWFANKEVLRLAMLGTLPEAIRLRPKTPLAGFPDVEQIRQPGARWVDHFEPQPELARYVERSAIPSVAGEVNSGKLWMNLRPRVLNTWLRQRGAVQHVPTSTEASHALGR
jgi:asparagine synthase (glutamine-hydrolysing)